MELSMRKYWNQRYDLWHRFDRGIQMDRESWYSVTPENIAKSIARRCRCDVIVDGFCGVGGNSIQFAYTCERVISIDIDPEKIRMARENARIYGVEDRIEFIVGDYFHVVPKLRAVDVVFLSPPWGGPKYIEVHALHMDHDELYNCFLQQFLYIIHRLYVQEEVFDIQTMMPVDGFRVFEIARKLTKDVAYYVPRNVNGKHMMSLAGPGEHCELQPAVIRNRIKAVTGYYGSLVLDSHNNNHVIY